MALKNIRLVFDGTYTVAGNDFSADELTLSKNKEEKTGVGTEGERSTSIVLRGDARTYVLDKLTVGTDPHLKSIKIEIFNDCCANELVFEGKIKGDSLQFCDGGRECELDITPIEDTTASNLLDFLNTQLISDSDYINNTKHLQVPYCIEYRPLGLAYVVLIIGILTTWVTIILQAILIPFALVVEVVNKVIKVLSFGLAKIKIAEEKNLIKEAIGLISEVRKWVIRCNEKHPAILQKDWIGKNLTENGYAFESSIINNLASVYSQGYHIFADTKKGWETPKNGLIKGNEPLITCKEYLDILAETYNAEWTIEENKVLLEKKNLNNKGSRFLLDRSLLTDEGICYETNAEQIYAKRDVKSLQDGIDLIGGEGKSEYGFLLNWNSGGNKNQKGVEKLIQKFAPARFFGDGIEPNPLGSAVLKPLITTVLGVNLGNLKNRLLLSTGLIPESAPKLIHLDSSGTAIKANEIYKKDAMSVFHEIDNPNNNVDYKTATFTFETKPLFDCSDIDKFRDCIGREFTTDKYSRKAIIDGYDWNIIENTFTVRGRV